MMKEQMKDRAFIKLGECLIQVAYKILNLEAYTNIDIEYGFIKPAKTDFLQWEVFKTLKNLKIIHPIKLNKGNGKVITVYEENWEWRKVK